MKIGIPKETKIHEYRIAMVPGGVRELVDHGHTVLVEKNAGIGSGFSDRDFTDVGAKIVSTPEEVFAGSDMVIKVKEPNLDECKMLSEDQILFTYLHLASARELTEALCKSGVAAIAYETVTAPDGSLPLLIPMSEVAGRMSIQIGAMCQQKYYSGAGILLGGVAGVRPANVVILGGGIAGTNAAEMAVGLKADVTVVDRSLKRLRELSARFGNQLKTCYSTRENIENLVVDADLVIGAVLVAGAKAPKLINRNLLKRMRPGSVLVDISIDQGGCFETSHATTHDEPTYIVDGIVHYCVANMPGAVARTSTIALTNATLPYITELARSGLKKALLDNCHLREGLNVYKGVLTNDVIASDLKLEYLPYTV